MDTVKRAAEIRQTLKAKHGWTSRQVSVKSHLYSGGSSIRISIMDPAIPKSAVEAVAQGHESVRYCEYTHEILSGGNRFVFVDYGRPATEAFAARYAPAVEAALATLPPDSTCLAPIAGTPFLVGRDRGLSLWGASFLGSYNDARALAERLGAAMLDAETVASATAARTTNLENAHG